MQQKLRRRRTRADLVMAGHPSRRFPPVTLLVIICICVVVELVLSLADYGVIGQRYWRILAYNWGAFSKPILFGEQPPYFPFQQEAMFVTYSFLHGGLLHLIVNMIALWSFGSAIIRRVGEKKFLIVYAVSAIGGAIGYALLPTPPVPMVGASGALFGLLGLWICWDYLERKHFGEPMWVTYRALIYLVVYNLVFWLLLEGRLAWETHLGGFLAGWFLGIFWGRTVGRNRRQNAGRGAS